jgi:DNA polymerase III epsilon subunit family exonuclease
MRELPHTISIAAMKTLDVRETEFTIFDTETTGLDPFSDRIIELAAIRVRGDEKISTFQTLVDPQRPVSEGAFRVNGISDAMLIGAPRMAEIIPRFSKFIRGSCLCSYNAAFDMGFITNEYQLAGVEFPKETTVVDILAMARHLLPLERHALWYVAQSLGIGDGQEHRALADVELTLGVFSQLKARLREKDITDIEDYVGLFGRGCQSHQEMQRQKISQIQRAIDLKATIRIKYFSRSDTRVSERDVIPREIKIDRNRAYLIGFCCARNSERTFSITGILRLEMLGLAAPE